MKEFGRTLLHLPAKLIYCLWGLWNHLLYPPRIRYADRETKRLWKHTPCILIANHTSHTDGYFLPQVMGNRRLYTYVTRKWYDKKNLHWMFSSLHYLPVDLTDMDTAWLSRGQEVLASGGSILIFPEGKLVKDGTLGEFHPGALMLARKTGVPVLPVALVGPYRKFRRKTVLVGRPLELDLARRGRPSLILREESEKCRAVLSEMLGASCPVVAPAPVPSVSEPLPDLPTEETIPEIAYSNATI